MFVFHKRIIYYYDENGIIVPYSADGWAVIITEDYTLKSGPGINYDDVVRVYAGEQLYSHFEDGDWAFFLAKDGAFCG